MLPPTAACRNTLRETSSGNELEKRRKNVIFAILSMRGFGSWRPRISRSAGARPPRFRSGLDFISSAPKESKTRGFGPILKMSFLRGPSMGSLLGPTAIRRNTLRETSSDNKREKRQTHVVFAILLERGFGSWRPRIFRSAGARPPRFRSWLDFKLLRSKRVKNTLF